MTESNGTSASGPHGTDGPEGADSSSGQSRYPQYPQYPQSPGPSSVTKPGVIPLRPLGLGEILDGAISTMRRYAGVVFGASAVVALVSAALYLVADLYVLDALEPAPVIDPNASQEQQLDQAVDALQGSLATSGVAAVVTVLTQTLLTGFLIAVVGQAVIGKAVTVGEVWRDLKPRVLSLFGLTILLTIIVAVGFLLLVIPGIYLTVILSLATAALILERGSIRQSMSRSWSLVKGSWWRVFGILLLANIIAGVLAILIQLPFELLAGTPEAGEGFSMGGLLTLELGVAVATAITAPFTACVTALLYIDQRMRKEGLDLELARAAGTA